MNCRKFILSGCMVLCVFAVSPATAQMSGHRPSMGRMPMHRAPMMNSPSGLRRWGDRNFDRDDRFHHSHFNEIIFIGDFGFPWWWGWGWGPWRGWNWGYPYGYYGGYGSGNGYGDSSRSRVAELQRLLARAGYYHGAIDGIMGPGTRRAIRAYERDHGYVG
jgi:Putative peptidoglycan binding domain